MSSVDEFYRLYEAQLRATFQAAHRPALVAAPKEWGEFNEFIRALALEHKLSLRTVGEGFELVEPSRIREIEDRVFKEETNA